MEPSSQQDWGTKAVGWLLSGGLGAIGTWLAMRMLRIDRPDGTCPDIEEVMRRVDAKLNEAMRRADDEAENRHRDAMSTIRQLYSRFDGLAYRVEALESHQRARGGD